MFVAATIQEIKKELETRSQKELINYCLALSKYKKDNKGLLSYILFESDNPLLFSEKVKAEIDENFDTLHAEKNLYFTKKSLRKILRMVTRYSKYAASNAVTAEWLLYFCSKLKSSGIPYESSPVLVNMFQNQVRKIKTLVSTLHADMQFDYLHELSTLES